MFRKRILAKLLGELQEAGVVKGPLGVWPFPVINLGIKVLKSLKER